MSSGRNRVVAALAIAVLVLGVGFVVGYRITLNRLDQAIPQEDLFGSGTPSPTGSPRPEPSPDGWDIRGPLNILIAGHDMVPEVSFRQTPHSDAVLILHIDATLTHAYLTSLPRDLLVRIPANPASGTGAHSSDKLTHAMGYGAQVPGSDEKNLAQGFALLARTVSDYTGIEHFDAGAVLSFEGLSRLIDAIGGIDLYVDHEVRSIHMGPDGVSAEEHGGPFQTYEVGMFHFNGWQALDYARQRYSLPDGAYGRERHQRQMIQAIVAKVLDLEVVAHPRLAPLIVAAVGDAVTLDLRGRKLHEYAYALRNLRPEAITLVGLPGSSVFGSSGYRGERLHAIQEDYFEAVRTDTVAAFLAANPTLVDSPGL